MPDTSEIQQVVDTTEVNTESNRQLATVQKITSLEPIDGADRIEVATILGWHLVVQKGLHKIGDLVLYIEVDAKLPEISLFEWMRPYNFKVKTIKLKGQISQGIVIPLIEVTYYLDARDGTDIKGAFKEGDDLTFLLGITKYVVPEKDLSGGQSQVRKGRASNWPNFISKTDELRIQGVYAHAEKYKGKMFYWAEKLDGQSTTCYFYKGEFGVCSRNFDLEPLDTDPFWRVARQEKIEEKLRKAFEDTGIEYAIQAERAGAGCQCNKLKLQDTRLYVFNVKNLTYGGYLAYEDFKQFCAKYGFITVPLGEPFVFNQTCDELVKMATIKSSLNKDIWVEGIVCRYVDESEDHKLGGRVSFKAMNPEFDIKYNK